MYFPHYYNFAIAQDVTVNFCNCLFYGLDLPLCFKISHASCVPFFNGLITPLKTINYNVLDFSLIRFKQQNTLV